MSVLVSIQPTV